MFSYSTISLDKLTHVLAHLSEVKLEHIADIMWRTLRELDQLLPVLEGLTQLLHAGLHPVHSVDALQRGKGERKCQTNKQKKETLTLTV